VSIARASRGIAIRSPPLRLHDEIGWKGRGVPEEIPISVVVMGYRNRDTIIAALTSVVEQASPDPYEILVVVSGDDGSAAAVRRHYPTQRVVESTEQLLPGGARNVGIANTSGTFVAFLAADCIAEPGWIEQRLAAHRSGHALVASAITHAGPDRACGWASYFDLFSGRLAGRSAGVVRPPDPAAHGLSYDRLVLERLHGFDDEVAAGEDTRAALAADALGYEVWFEPTVRTAHTGPATTRELLADEYRRGSLRARVTGDALGPTTRCRMVVAFVPVWLIWLRTRVARGWRHAPEHRSQLLRCLPWLAAARAAGVAGWYQERLRGSPSGCSIDRARGAR
jgi:GT2 family glycosyltransferase